MEADGSARERTTPPRTRGMTSWRAADFFMIELMNQEGTEGTLGLMTALKLEDVIGTGFRGLWFSLNSVLRSHCADLLRAPNGNLGQETGLAPTKAARGMEARRALMRPMPGSCLGGPHLRGARGNAMPREAPRQCREGAATAATGRALALTSASREVCACNPAAATDGVGDCARRARQVRTHISITLPLEDSPFMRRAMTGALDLLRRCAAWRTMAPRLTGERRLRRVASQEPPNAGTEWSDTTRLARR